MLAVLTPLFSASLITGRGYILKRPQTHSADAKNQKNIAKIQANITNLLLAFLVTQKWNHTTNSLPTMILRV
eukprot:snap_masked-scaffold_20-processed-gene-5.70-mRNA-1 protein AED:1.00 eAED:1.00 QI:0/-1/0/0/-1/1/1/0/71